MICTPSWGGCSFATSTFAYEVVCVLDVACFFGGHFDHFLRQAFGHQAVWMMLTHQFVIFLFEGLVAVLWGGTQSLIGCIKLMGGSGLSLMSAAMGVLKSKALLEATKLHLNAQALTDGFEHALFLGGQGAIGLRGLNLKVQKHAQQNEIACHGVFELYQRSLQLKVGLFATIECGSGFLSLLGRHAALAHGTLCDFNFLRGHDTIGFGQVSHHRKRDIKKNLLGGAALLVCMGELKWDALQQLSECAVKTMPHPTPKHQAQKADAQCFAEKVTQKAAKKCTKTNHVAMVRVFFKKANGCGQILSSPGLFQQKSIKHAILTPLSKPRF